VINEVRSGVSPASGREWKNQDVIVAWPEHGADGYDHEQVQQVSLRGEQVQLFAALQPQVGMQLVMDLAFGTRQYNGRVYNETRGFVVAQPLP